MDIVTSLFSSPTDKLTAAHNEFGLELFQKLVRAERTTSPSSNVFISPLSVAVALGMTSLGAVGNTLAQLRKALRHEQVGNEDKVKQLSAQFLKDVESKQAEAIIEIANSVWLSKNILPQFIQEVSQSFHSEAKPLSDAATVNAWVSSKTHGMIPTIISNVDPQTAIIVVNAVFFKGAWSKSFNKSATELHRFHPEQGDGFDVQMMNQKDHLKYHEQSTFQMVSLPYGPHHKYAAAILLPQAGSSVDSLIDSLNEKEWKKHLGSLQDKEVTLYLPRLKVEYGNELKEALESQGIHDLFKDSGELTRLTPEPAKVEKIIHKAVVELDEEGTTAAAATAVMAIAGCIVDKPLPKKIVMTCDHPFVLVIYDTTNHGILFLGKIVRPHPSA